MACYSLTIWLFIIVLNGAQISVQQIISGDTGWRGRRQLAQSHVHIPSDSSEPPLTSGLSYRALATNQYRNFYRNRNYFVRTDLGKLEHNTVIPNSKDKKPSTSDQIGEIGSIFQNQYNETERPTHTNSDSIHKDINQTERDTKSPAEQDDPILFEDADAAPYSAYVRPLEPVDVSTPSATVNTVPQSKKSDELPAEKKFEPVPDGKTPPCAHDAVYCESFDNYPRKLLNEVLERSITPQEFQQVYGETTDNSTKITDLLQRTGLSPGAAAEETPLCAAVEHTIYPQIARNKENKWLYVVNHDEYIQGVRIEKCLDEGQSCFYGDTAPIGYQTACRQKYIYKKLLALTPEGRTSSESFKLPSCCACFVKTASIADRLLGTAVGSSQISRPVTKIPGSYYTYENENQDDLDNTTELFITTQSMEATSK